jgi:heterodisulfide reductase subunit B
VNRKCKTCEKLVPIEDSLSWVENECEPCRVKYDRRQLRFAGCFLVPLWFPFWAAGNLIGLAFGVFWKG